MSRGDKEEGRGLAIPWRQQQRDPVDLGMTDCVRQDGCEAEESPPPSQLTWRVSTGWGPACPRCSAVPQGNVRVLPRPAPGDLSRPGWSSASPLQPAGCLQLSPSSTGACLGSPAPLRSSHQEEREKGVRGETCPEIPPACTESCGFVNKQQRITNQPHLPVHLVFLIRFHFAWDTSPRPGPSPSRQVEGFW